MAMDRITKIAVTFSDGTKEMTRTYTVIPDTSFIKADNPQSPRSPGYVEVKGNVLSYEDTNAPE